MATAFQGIGTALPGPARPGRDWCGPRRNGGLDGERPAPGGTARRSPGPRRGPPQARPGSGQAAPRGPGTRCSSPPGRGPGGQAEGPGRGRPGPRRGPRGGGRRPDPGGADLHLPAGAPTGTRYAVGRRSHIDTSACPATPPPPSPRPGGSRPRPWRRRTLPARTRRGRPGRRHGRPGRGPARRRPRHAGGRRPDGRPGRWAWPGRAPGGPGGRHRLRPGRCRPGRRAGAAGNRQPGRRPNCRASSAGPRTAGTARCTRGWQARCSGSHPCTFQVFESTLAHPGGTLLS